MFFLCSVYVLVYVLFMFDLFFVDDLRMALFFCFFVLCYACLHKKTPKKT